MKYSVGIVTYVKRFEKFFKPLILEIKKQRPEIEIIVCVNGEHKEKFNENYRQDILNCLSELDNSFVCMHPQFRSLSKLWNTCLINATNDNMLLLNDDVRLDTGFFDELETHINNSSCDYFKINDSWSHTFLNRKLVGELHWFDERLLGVGGEDNDFEWRFFNKFKYAFPSKKIKNIFNFESKERVLTNQRKTHANYSQFNTEFINLKYRPKKNGQMHGLWFSAEQVMDTPNMNPCESFFWANKENK